MDKLKPFTLPNYVSYVALLLSWVSILLILNGSFHLSLGTALLAFVADSLDGFIARKLKQESDFGRQFDSFVDVLIYLIYPSLVYYLYFEFQDVAAIVVVYVFILTGVFRLVRFNLIGYIGKKDMKGYPGLPVFVSYLVLLLIYLGSSVISGGVFEVLALSLILLQSILMVQTFVFPKPDRIWPLIVFLVLLAAYMFYLGLR